jgi:hypothetical protein
MSAESLDTAVSRLRPRTACVRCGYAVGTERVALLIDGRTTIETTLCVAHRREVVALLTLGDARALDANEAGR